MKVRFMKEKLFFTNRPQSPFKWFFLVFIIIGMNMLVSCTSCEDTSHDTSDYQKYNRLFNDMNDIQLKAAQKYGIQPVEDRKYPFDANEKLVKVSSCKSYDIDRLTHSVP